MFINEIILWSKMLDYLTLPLKFPIYNISRKIGKPLIMPLNFTYSITTRCNSRCKTCMLWKTKPKDELSLEEWKKVLKSIGRVPFWVTITGGTQFLRPDFIKIFRKIVEVNKPKIINLPLNASDVELCLMNIKKCLEIMNHSTLIVNISIDGIEETHNFLRGANGAYLNMLKTIGLLKEQKKTHKNLLIGGHMTLSRFNVSQLKHMIQNLKELGLDHYGFEIAEKRKELKNQGENFVLEKKDVLKAIKIILDYTQKPKGILILKDWLRLKYYEQIKKSIEHDKEITPCYAGLASVQIAPDGSVWQCCTKAGVLGNLRQNKYDFKKVFYSKRADKIRHSIKKDKCFCTNSNAYYTSILSSLL